MRSGNSSGGPSAGDPSAMGRLHGTATDSAVMLGRAGYARQNAAHATRSASSGALFLRIASPSAGRLMKTQQFLEHHGIRENPFGQEDAQSDHVFKQHCLAGTHHPAWDKILGNPGEPSTSVVFGEKGSGKTALRLQIVKQVEEHNATQPEKKVFVVEYDDFNPFLDAFRERLFGRKKNPDRALRHWRLWDHMDAILSLAVTRLVRGVLDSGTARGEAPPRIAKQDVKNLDRNQKRDLLMLAAYYDHSYDQPRYSRWNELRAKLMFPVWMNAWDKALGLTVTAITLLVVMIYAIKDGRIDYFAKWWVWVIIVAAWVPYALRQMALTWTATKVKRQIRVFDHLPGTLRKVLSRFSRSDLAGQPVPDKDRSDDRYEMLHKLQGILNRFGYKSMLVLVDRVDEPHLINGNPERMRDLLWPMFDNKFLKHPGIGFKLLLPAEVTYYLNREEKEFYERSRLDKQNLVPSLEWTGESLYDVANDRLKACAADGTAPKVGSLFDPGIDRDELVRIFARLRVPRHLFKFLYRLMVEHCNRYTEEQPRWTISREALDSTLSLYMRDLSAFDRGMGTG